MSMLKVSAPGDEYFGRMKMSYLGINNTFHDELIRAGAYTTDPGLVAKIEFADEALVSWAKKYPNDPQLARSYFLAFQMYRKVWVQRYQDKAWDYAHIVVRKWPSSFFGKTLKKDLQIGFTEHYFAVPVACPEMPEVDASATPNKHATPTPSPTPTPEPTPTPSPAPGRPPAQVLPVPCFTPSPAPTIAPVVAPSGTPAPVPSGSLLPSPAASGSASPSASPSPIGSPSPAATHRP